MTILNPGFEQLVIGGNGGAFGYVLYDIPNWTFTGEVGTFKPDGGQFPGGVPEGVNVAAIGNQSGSGSISQTLNLALQPHMRYSLMVDVGRRLDFPFTTYSVELLAGSEVIATGSNVDPSAGNFQLEELSFTTGETHAQIGQDLGIRLTTNIAGGQVDFDNVRLNVSAIPEPSFFAFGLLSSVVVATRRRRWSPENRVQ
ncbi:hypothetical protein LOC67_22860 [Stieleria sp. JC731]|uniref:hypothetical protein n=1 Tax=Pirellulaceae TaxID=2691357 RepID=UPI001E360F6F|nr:hypothetical protein [Stieleria sp. JC731]MCC9603401.1 hypothetical protein [Stieleria sp. JC731]